MKKLALPFVTTTALACATPEVESRPEPTVVAKPPATSTGTAPAPETTVQAEPPPEEAPPARRFELQPPEGGYGPGARLFGTLAPGSDGNCRLSFAVECPGAVCNPPPPRTVSCHGPEWRIEAAFSKAYPEGAVLWKKVERRPDGTCLASFSVDCLTPPGGRCNPPAPRTVDCD